jgi:hypothetical protein
MHASTDHLRGIADEMDADGVDLAGFVLVAVHPHDGGTVRVLGTLPDRNANAMILRMALRLLDVRQERLQ